MKPVRSIYSVCKSCWKPKRYRVTQHRSSLNSRSRQSFFFFLLTCLASYLIFQHVVFHFILLYAAKIEAPCLMHVDRKLMATWWCCHTPPWTQDKKPRSQMGSCFYDLKGHFLKFIIIFFKQVNTSLKGLQHVSLNVPALMQLLSWFSFFCKLAVPASVLYLEMNSPQTPL